MCTTQEIGTAGCKAFGALCIPYLCPVLVWRWHHILFSPLRPPALPRRWMSFFSCPFPKEIGPHGSLGKLRHLQSPGKTGWEYINIDQKCFIDLLKYAFEDQDNLVTCFCYLPQAYEAPSLSFVRRKGALWWKRPGQWSRTSGPEVSPLLPAHLVTAEWVPVKSWEQ